MSRLQSVLWWHNVIGALTDWHARDYGIHLSTAKCASCGRYGFQPLIPESACTVCGISKSVNREYCSIDCFVKAESTFPTYCSNTKNCTRCSNGKITCTSCRGTGLLSGQKGVCNLYKFNKEHYYCVVHNDNDCNEYH